MIDNKENDVYTQQPYRCRLDWGRDGTRRAAERGDALVIVDTLRFSTAVVTAIHYGGIVYPCSHDEDAEAIARRVKGEVAMYRRSDVPSKSRFSLSPLTYINIEPGTRVVLASPNGGTCSRYAREVSYLFVGTLVNAQAVAQVVSHVLENSTTNVTLIACGERWKVPSEDGALRLAIEDYLSAGAILSYLQQSKSPEARVCEGAFVQSRHELAELLWESSSGRELRVKGVGEDVRHAAQLNVYNTVPVMRDDHLEAFFNNASTNATVS